MSNVKVKSIYDIQKSSFVVSYRLIILLLGIADLLYANISGLMQNAPLVADKYFTYQSNIFVDFWLFLALLWRNKPEKLEKISGGLRGAITVYISITFIVYGIVLAPLANPTGIDLYLNLIHHYIVPFVFILDYFYTERKKIEWIFILPWMVYPHLYLAFSYIMGTFITPRDYIYFFLDVNELGVLGYLKWYIILISLFFVLSVVYIGYNKYINKKSSLGT